MGAVLALIKQSFALVWICIVVIVPLLVMAQNADPPDVAHSRWPDAGCGFELPATLMAANCANLRRASASAPPMISHTCSSAARFCR